MRRGLAILLGVIAAAGLVAVIFRGASEDPPLARTGDGAHEVRAAVYGRTMDYKMRRAGLNPWNWRTEGRVSFPVDRLCVHVRGAAATPAFEASCGCRFEPDMTAGGGGDDTVYSAYDFPRRERTLRMRFGTGDGAVAEFANPFPAPSPASIDSVAELPATTRLGDQTWILALSPDTPPRLAVRALDAGRSGFEWTFRSAVLSDASGNRVHRATDAREEREHRIALPLAGVPFVLCPHEPWWELEVVLDNARTVRWRFAPPR